MSVRRGKGTRATHLRPTKWRRAVVASTPLLAACASAQCATAEPRPSANETSSARYTTQRWGPAPTHVFFVLVQCVKHLPVHGFVHLAPRKMAPRRCLDGTCRSCLRRVRLMHRHTTAQYAHCQADVLYRCHCAMRSETMRGTYLDPVLAHEHALQRVTYTNVKRTLYQVVWRRACRKHTQWASTHMVGLTGEVPLASHTPIVQSLWPIQVHADPDTVAERRGADVAHHTRLDSTNQHPLPNAKGPRS